MNRRMELQELLESVEGLATDPRTGRSAVYFQPPPSLAIVYPCIIFSLSNVNTRHADNQPYANRNCYTVTIIDQDPDSEIPNFLLNMPLCSFDRAYSADNLNHWAFSLFY